MARYELAFTTPAAAAGAALFDIRTAATNRVRVLEIGLTSNAATAVTPSVERSTTLGTQTSPVSPLALDTGEAAATALIGTAWSVAPAGSTTNQFRKVALPANIGAGIIWTFGGGGLVIPVSSGLVVMNRAGATGPAMSGYVVIEE